MNKGYLKAYREAYAILSKAQFTGECYCLTPQGVPRPYIADLDHPLRATWHCVNCHPDVSHRYLDVGYKSYFRYKANNEHHKTCNHKDCLTHITRAYSEHFDPDDITWYCKEHTP